MKKNVLLVEDDGAALGFVDALEVIHGYDIFLTANWAYVSSWLDDKPGHKDFYALIFNLRVPAYKLAEYAGRPYDEKIDVSPSLYFIEYFIRPRYPLLLKKIIIVSAYVDEVNVKYRINTGRCLASEFKLVNKFGGDTASVEILKLLGDIDV